MKLSELTNEQLLREAIKAIQDGALGESRGGDDASYEQAMTFLAESDRRLVAAGHHRRCQSGLYSRAFEAATAQHAGREPRLLACSCGAGDA